MASRGSMLVHDNANISFIIAMITRDPSRFTDALHKVPKVLVDELSSELFKQQCAADYKLLDKDGTGHVDPQGIFPTICKICQTHSFTIDKSRCDNCIAVFGRTMSKPDVSEFEFTQLARFVVVMGYLHWRLEHQEAVAAEILLGKDKLTQLIGQLKGGLDKVNKIIPYLPPSLIDELSSKAFYNQCLSDFAALDQEKRGALGPKEIYPVILHLTEVHHYSLTPELADHFISIFDIRGNGVINQDEWVNFVQFMMVMSYLETEEGMLMSVNMDKLESEAIIEGLLTTLQNDRAMIHKVVPLLPKHIYDSLTSEEFVMACHQRFVELDKEKTGVLMPHELYPIVVELSQADPAHISLAQCERFTDIFDLTRSGHLNLEEFLDFARFLRVMCYLSSEEGMKEAEEAIIMLESSKRVEDLLHDLNADKKLLQRVIPYLPAYLRDELLSEHFTARCNEDFVRLDKAGNGRLDPHELWPLIQHMADLSHMPIDMEHCEKFTAIFDDAKTGYISRSEFVRFTQFLFIMNFLESHDGQEVLNIALSGDAPLEASTTSTALVPARPAEPSFEPPARPQAPQGQAPAKQRPGQRKSVEKGHLVVDCEFYQRKAEKLQAENDALRARMQSLEAIVRQLEDKMELNENRLRHAEVDLRAAGVRM